MKKETFFLSDDDNVVEFKKPVLKVDSQDPPTDGHDWLGNLSRGAVFLTRNKATRLDDPKPIDLSQYRVIVPKTRNGAVFLELIIADKQGELREIPVWVDSQRFSQAMFPFEILRTEEITGEFE